MPLSWVWMVIGYAKELFCNLANRGSCWCHRPPVHMVYIAFGDCMVVCFEQYMYW
jgi:hypothetical protein